jgi:hypothetical protein
MNWGMPARPYVGPQLPVEGIPGRAVNMDLKPISSLLPTYGHNHQVDAEARSLVGCGASP